MRAMRAMRVASKAPSAWQAWGGRSKSHVVRLLTRMDEGEEVPRMQVHEGAEAAFGQRLPLALRASKFGRGVFAEAAAPQDAEVEVCPVLVLRRDHVAPECSGMRYFFSGAHGDDLLCVLGYGMLYNHAPTRPSGHGWSPEYANLGYAARPNEPGAAEALHTAPATARDAADGGVCVRFVALRSIEAGEELLIDYSDRWWQSKDEKPR
ncbi:unnamed protein product [Effrenium voratum]|nr:unnamed protein product [Effrenium voratum]